MLYVSRIYHRYLRGDRNWYANTEELLNSCDEMMLTLTDTETGNTVVYNIGRQYKKLLNMKPRPLGVSNRGVNIYFLVFSEKEICLFQGLKYKHSEKIRVNSRRNETYEEVLTFDGAWGLNFKLRLFYMSCIDNYKWFFVFSILHAITRYTTKIEFLENNTVLAIWLKDGSSNYSPCIYKLYFDIVDKNIIPELVCAKLLRGKARS